MQHGSASDEKLEGLPESLRRHIESGDPRVIKLVDGRICFVLPGSVMYKVILSSPAEKTKRPRYISELEKGREEFHQRLIQDGKVAEGPYEVGPRWCIFYNFSS